MKYILLLTTLLTLTVTTVFASDLAREERMRAEIEDAILDGEPMTLEAGDVSFMAIYTETEADSAKGGVIIMHGMGVHPDWPDIINPLRVALPQDGWNTLSIQLPVAASDATFQDYIPLLAEASPRIAAAVDFLKEQGMSHIILLSHSLGGRMAAIYLANNPDPAVEGFIAVGLSVRGENEASDTIAHLGAVQVPVLDIYGSDDLEEVLETTEARKTAPAKSAGQYEVKGADHFFRGKDSELYEITINWLDTTFNTN